MLHPDRLLPADPGVRRLARALYERTRDLPIVSPHGHLDPAAFADDAPVDDIAHELVSRDHYVLRMLHSQGVPLEALGRRPLGDDAPPTPGREVWHTFAEHWHRFRATPTRQWIEHTLGEVLGIDVPLGPDTADDVYDAANERLADPAYRPRALYERFGLEFLATTDAALDPLEAHARLRDDRWPGRVVPTFRPDDVVDPDRPDFAANLDRLADLTGEDTGSWDGYLAALRARRAAFADLGATATDHGPATPTTVDAPPAEAAALFARVRGGGSDGRTDGERRADAACFRGVMLTELAAMSAEDGLVMQIHPGSWRNHDPAVHRRFGPDAGADIPRRVDFVGGLAPLLGRLGHEPRLTVVLYTLDESTYSRELAPLAGHYPVLRLGPAWWFHDSPEGMRRFRRLVTETAGFHNTVGFNDDARSLLTIPARHDVARRIDAGFLAELVAEHRLDEAEAAETAGDLAVGLARRAFRVDP